MGTPKREGSYGKLQQAVGEVSPLRLFLKKSMQPLPRRSGTQPAAQFAIQSHPIAQTLRAESWILGPCFPPAPLSLWMCSPQSGIPAEGSQYVGLCLVPWGSMNHTEGVGGCRARSCL